MPVSRLTAMMIAANPVEIFETPERLEAWTMRDGHRHALMLSCPLDKRPDLEEAIETLKREYGEPTQVPG